MSKTYIHCGRVILARLFQKKFILFALMSLLSLTTPAPAATVTQAKVLTFNIWKQGGLSLNNCIEVIRASGADLVGLQECNAATAQTIATSLGFYVLPVSDSSIVSRYPILNTYIAGNSCGITVRLSPTQRAHFFNCHPAAYPYGPYDLKTGQTTGYILDQENSVRMPAVSQLISAMQPFINGSEPCFLTGDFNAPSHLDYATFPWPTSLACTKAGLKDSYRELHSANRTYPAGFAYIDPGITWSPKPDQEPNGVFDRIDFVYYLPRGGAVPTTSTELDERNSINPWPSDHRAVLTSFTLTPPTPADKATLPAPANQTTNVESNPILNWQSGSNATSHAMYLGTNASLTLFTNVTDSTVTLTNLLRGTTYFWRVDESTPDGLVSGDVWSFTTRGNSVYEWNFANGNLAPVLGDGVLAFADVASSNLTTFGATDGANLPHIGGAVAKFMRVPAFSGVSNGLLVTLTGSQPNGGGQYLNQYTLIFDMLLPSPLSWGAIFNTSPTNSNDADFYIGSDGSLGIGDIGYSASGVIKGNAWNRVAVAADLEAGTVKYYVNGTLVRSGNSGLDGRFALFSNLNPGADLLLFNEGDSSGVYTHVVYLSSLFATDRTLSANEIAALGSPKARGILASADPVKLSIGLQDANVVLNWTGGEGPFVVQKTSSVAGGSSWQNVNTANLNTAASVPFEVEGAFFRILDQGL